MRAEIAALSGELHLVQEMVRLLKRDGIQEDLEEINTMVHKHVARLMMCGNRPDDISIKKEVLFEPQNHSYGSKAILLRRM